MWWAQAISAGLSLFGAGQQMSGARDARKIAGLNVKASEAETAETLRRQRMEGEQRVGYARAIAGASGFSIQPGTSQQNYIDEMVAENRRQLSFTAQAGKREAGILKRGGELAYRSGQAGAIGSVANAASSIGTMWTLGKEQAAPWGN